MVEMAGFKDTTAFLNTITPELEMQVMQQASQPQQDPSAEAARMLADIEKAKAELRAQTDNAKNELEREKMQLDNARKQLELEQKAYKDNAEIAIKQMKLQIDAAKAQQSNDSMQLDSVMNSLTSLQKIAKNDINMEE
jgi:hypothetical protein